MKETIRLIIIITKIINENIYENNCIDNNNNSYKYEDDKIIIVLSIAT